MSDVTDLLTHAVNKSPVEFADAFNDLMQQKARDAVEAHRVTLAQSIYNSADEDEDEDVVDNEDIPDDDDTEDYDGVDDLDLDDLADIDLDDLDLDNEDGTDEDA
jgi:hypothetical protein